MNENEYPPIVWKLLDLLALCQVPPVSYDDFCEFIQRNFDSSTEDLKNIHRELVFCNETGLEESTVNKLGLQDALTICLGQNPPLTYTYRRSVAGILGTQPNPLRVNLTKAGKAALALRKLT